MSDDYGIDEEFDIESDYEDFLEEQRFEIRQTEVARVIQYLRSLANDFRNIDEEAAAEDAEFVDQIADVFADPSWLKR